MHKVASILKDAISSKQKNPNIDSNMDKANNEERTSLETFKSVSETEEDIIDSNIDLSVPSDIIAPSSQSQIYITNLKNKSSNVSIQTNLSEISYESTFNKVNNIIVERLILIINKKTW